MTRPRKQTVDYFPHDCNHGETMFIIEQRYGNDGYAFWFKLLELLGKSDGHFLDCNKLSTWHYLCTRSGVGDGAAIDILNLLADLNAIDTELWQQNKIIWSDNFVNGLSFAYRNREIQIPDKPVILRKESGICGTSDVRNPQSKVNESKVNESKGNEETPPQEAAPLPSKKKSLPKPRKTFLPENFAVSDNVKAWALENNFGNLHEHLEAFKRKATMKGYSYVNWDMAFIEAIREDWAKLRSGNGQGQRVPALPINKADAVTLGNLQARDRLLKKYQEQGE